jgi:membrane-associated phospholipid phosphatase
MERGFGSRAAIFLGSGLVLTGLAYQFADRAWSSFAHATFHKPAWAELLTKLGDVPAPLAWLGLLAVLVVFYSGTPVTRRWRIVLAVGVATMLAAVGVLVAKHMCGRPWPETWLDGGNISWIRDKFFGFVPMHGGTDYTSFPSGHTARVSAPLAVLWQTLPRWRVAYAAPLIAVIVGLLVCDFHFVSDCVAGVYLGVACAWVALTVVGPED